jgi:transcriptional regulator with XRE-family HTH domain
MATGSISTPEGVGALSDGMGSRIARLRERRGISARELATLSAVTYGDVVALESGARRTLPGQTIRRLADFFQTTTEYLLQGEVPGPAALRAGFLKRYDALDPEERLRLKFAPIQSRMEAVLTFLEDAYPTVLDRTQVAARLGYSPDALTDVLSGTATLQSHVLRRLADMVGLPMEFLVRGDFFGGAVAAEQDLSPTVLSEYYQVVQEAIAAGVTPAQLRKAVKILAIRDQEE